MVGHLEEVDPGQAAGEQDRIDLLLDIAGEQEALGAECPEQDDRDVVDRRAPVGRFTGHGVAVRPEDLERDRVELKAVAGRQQPRRAGLFRETGPKGVVGRAGPDHARLEDPADPVALDQPRQAAGVILVGMAQDQHIDPAVPGRNPGIELKDQAIRIRPTVDEQPSATIAFDQDRITLADVEDRDVNTAVGTCGEPGGHHGHDQGEAGQTRQGDPARTPAVHHAVA